MRRTTFVGAVMMVAALGCGKKPEKKDAGPDSAPPPQASSIGTPGPAAGPSPGVIPSGGAGGGVVLNPQGLVAGGGGGGGAAQAVRKAALRTATRNELHQIHLFIETASGASGRMPPPEETLAALQKEAPKIAEAVKEGVIVLVAAKSREEIWAYEAIALERGGQAISNQGIEQMDATTLRNRLGNK